ncbi:hypothetical protein evm_005170 [Chilo suppressalis]|nr:hypothetical protein evm_005170 [Chilo suppressalis]
MLIQILINHSAHCRSHLALVTPQHTSRLRHHIVNSAQTGRTWDESVQCLIRNILIFFSNVSNIEIIKYKVIRIGSS